MGFVLVNVQIYCSEEVDYPIIILATIPDDIRVSQSVTVKPIQCVAQRIPKTGSTAAYLRSNLILSRIRRNLRAAPALITSTNRNAKGRIGVDSDKAASTTPQSYSSRPDAVASRLGLAGASVCVPQAGDRILTSGVRTLLTAKHEIDKQYIETQPANSQTCRH